jgi:DNA recombination protein RmuC
MDSNTIIIIAVVAVVSIFLGGVIGYLFGGKKDSGFEAEKAGAEAKATELEKQIGQKDTEISRRDDQIERNQEKLVAAEGAKSEAETKLGEAHADIAELRSQLEAKEVDRASYRDKAIAAEKKSAELDATNKAIIQRLAEQKQFLVDAEVMLREAFASLSSEALRKNNTSFLEAAKETLDAKVKESATELETRKTAIETLVKPLTESLKNFDGKLGEIELKREGAYSEMKTLLDAMKSTTDSLNSGTNQLVSALKTSHVRGKYGEISLRRVVEVAGLSPYCDFDEQISVTTETGRLRPDMNINLPGHRQLILDAKVPLSAYMRAFETDVESERAELMREHAVAVRKHLKELSHKSYWDQFNEAPDFVIMYLQIESSFGAALMADPALIEDAINHQIVIATPSTLITMLRTIGFMWQQERMAERIYEMRDAGIELYKRTNKMLEHFAKIGSGLNAVVNSYNSAVGSMESRVITQLEKIKEVGGTLTKDDLPFMKPVETAIRPLIKSIGAGESTEGDDS